MARTPLAHMLGDVASIARAAWRRNLPAEEIAAERAANRLTRRDFLKAAAVAGAMAALPAGIAQRAAAVTAPRIAVVGAGLAGLTCAYRLRRAGYFVTVYEGAGRVGGRCSTRRGAFADGQIVEQGGELIDTGHLAIRQLVRELGLATDNLLQAEKKGTEPLYYFNGRPYTYAQATADMQSIWQKVHKDVSAASYPTLYTQATPRGRELDGMSIIEWINESVPGGTGAPLGKLLDVAYTIEFGAECGDQSSLNLLYLLGYKGQGQLRVFGPSDEKHHVRGGNDQIPARLAGLLPGQIELGHELTAIGLNGGGSYRLTFRTGGGVKEVVADKVVLTIPFPILRERVDYSAAGFREVKNRAIRELGAGVNAKLHLQFGDRHWETLGCNGDTYADTGCQCTWEVTRAQPGAAGILVNYAGGNYAASLRQEVPVNDHAGRFLDAIEPVLPGIRAKWNRQTTLDNAGQSSWARGSYPYYRVGQYTTIAGAEGESEGNCHFAGDHTSMDFQGYMNGAVVSGERAAAEILADLKSGRKSGGS